MPPLIGISSTVEMCNGQLQASAPRSYATALTMSGATAVIVPVMPDAASAVEYVSRLDGLLLAGGLEDVQPQNYGERAVKGLARVNPERDVWEFALLEAALAQNKPVLGICRGCQLINVALGGSLYQDLRGQVPAASEHKPEQTALETLFHAVRIEEGTKLHGVFETSSLMVNSLHNQAIKDVATSLRVSARAEDGIVEAVESSEYPFLLGVQWHPEALVERYAHFNKLFRAFLAAV